MKIQLKLFLVSKIQIPAEILEKAQAESFVDPKFRPKSAFVASNTPDTTNRPKSALAKEIPNEECKNESFFNNNSKDSLQNERMWIFEKYMDENTQMIFLEAAEELRHVNVSVQQDIEDNLITEGLNISKEALEHRDKFKGFLFFSLLKREK